MKMRTITVGTEETGKYGAGKDEFAIQDRDGNRRAIITVDAEAEDEESVREMIEGIKEKVEFANYSIVPKEETSIPTNWKGIE